MYWDFGKGFNFYYNDLLNFLTEETRIIIKEKLGFDNMTTNYLTYVDPLYSFNKYLGIIFVGFIYKALKLNKLDFFKNNKIDELKEYISLMGFYHIYPAFNLTLEIDKIFEIINNLVNKNYNFENLKLGKLSIKALNEFNDDSSFYYKNAVESEVFKLKKKNILHILKNSKYYEQKYLKYKKKYLNLKKNI